MVALAFNLSYLEGKNQKITVPGQPRKKVSEEPISNNKPGVVVLA
jgi:hypothetical protein